MNDTELEDLIRRSGEEAPRSLDTRVRSTLRIENESAQFRPRLMWSSRLTGATAAVLLLVLAACVVFLVLNQRTTQPQEQAPPVVAVDDEPGAEDPPEVEPTPPEIIEAVARETVEPPSAPVPPSGHWIATLTKRWAGEEEPQTSDMSVTFTNSNGEITLLLEGSWVMRGSLNVRQATFEGEFQPGYHYALRGVFNPAFTVFEGRGSFTHDDQPQANSQFKIYATQFNEEESNLFELAALFNQREKEVWQLALTLRKFAISHDGAYPTTLRELPVKARELFAEIPGVDVTLHGGSRMRRSLPSNVSFNKYKTEYPYPDRLMMFEGELAAVREKGRSQEIMRVAYDEPKMIFTMDALGMVHIQEFEREDLLEGAAADAVRTSCANNMQQLGIVFKMFEHDHEGYSPPSLEYASPTYATDRAIFSCPADLPGEQSYEYLFPATRLNELALISARDFGLITEEQYNDPDPTLSAFAQSSLPLLVEQNPHIVERDGVQIAGFNVLFADGHVSFYTPEGLDANIGPYYALR